MPRAEGLLLGLEEAVQCEGLDRGLWAGVCWWATLVVTTGMVQLAQAAGRYSSPGERTVGLTARPPDNGSLTSQQWRHRSSNEAEPGLGEIS